MARENRGSVLRSIDRVFNQGSATGVAEGELLRQFAAHGDEAAFEALVTLHGPMVLGVCRRLLYEPRDVEDAFQATFLVLLPGRLAPRRRPARPVAAWRRLPGRDPDPDEIGPPVGRGAQGGAARIRGIILGLRS